MRRIRISTLALALLLVMPGTALAEPPIGQNPQCPDVVGHEGIRVRANQSPATIEVTNLVTGEPLSVVVTISGSEFTLTAADSTAELLDAEWCLRAGPESTIQEGLSGSSPSVHPNGTLRDINHAVVYWAYTVADWGT